MALAVGVRSARSEPLAVPHVPSPVHRFGEVKAGVVVEHEFAVINPTNVAVRITRVRTSCGCTVAKVEPDVIPAKGKVALRVVLKTAGRTGPQRKHVFISTDYPQAPFLRCSVEGKVRPAVAPAKVGPAMPLPVIEHSVHDFGTLPAGQAVVHDFQIRNTGTAWLEIQRVRTSCGCLVGKVTPKRIAPGKSRVLRVVLKTTGRIGRQRLSVHVTTNALTKRTLVCWVQGTLVQAGAVPQIPVELSAPPTAPAPPAAKN
jgi:hypothetical protein